MVFLLCFLPSAVANEYLVLEDDEDIAFSADENGLFPAQCTPIDINATKGYKADSRNYVSNWEYSDPTLRVEIEKDRYLDTDIWIAKVQIAHSSQLRGAFASRYGSQVNAVAPTIAKRVNAVIAVSGANYSYRDFGVVLQQGRLYRNRPNGGEDVLIIDDKGDLHAVIRADKKSFGDVYMALGGEWDNGGSMVNALTFGPLLIKDGAYAHEAYSRYSIDIGASKPTQRMVIAQTGPLNYLLVTCEGPESDDSRGLTMHQMAEYMFLLGCDIAYNLDGGSSSTLVFRDKKINSPSSGKIRPVADIIYFTTGISDLR